MAKFTGKVWAEGVKRYPVMAVPFTLGIPAGWARVVLPGAPPCFSYVRGATERIRRIALPAWSFPGLKVGDMVEAQIEPAEPHRARGARVGCFDWNTFVENDERTFATDEPNGILRLWSRYSAPFDLLRYPPTEALYWSLGFYQAEGSKGTTGNDFTFTNTNVELIRHAIEQLNQLGIAKSQLYAEILRGVGESRESALAKYESLGLEVATVHPRSGKGGSACTLHAHNSKPFLGMILRVLAHVFANEFPSREAARAFAFGWLDGDGTITLTDTDAKLRLAGLPEEHAVVKCALTQVFGWDLSSQSTRYKNSKCGSEIGLRADRIIDLLDADAFPFSMSRVRMLLGFARRACRLAEGCRTGSFVRWGLAERGGALTVQGNHVVEAHQRYASEIEKARRLWTVEPHHFGIKGAVLPPQFRLRIPQ